MDFVKSDGVRPKFSTARGGAAFLRVRGVVAGVLFALSVESFPRAVEFQESPMPVESERARQARTGANARTSGARQAAAFEAKRRLVEGGENEL